LLKVLLSKCKEALVSVLPVDGVVAFPRGWLPCRIS